MNIVDIKLEIEHYKHDINVSLSGMYIARILNTDLYICITQTKLTAKYCFNHPSRSTSFVPLPPPMTINSLRQFYAPYAPYASYVILICAHKNYSVHRTASFHRLQIPLDPSIFSIFPILDWCFRFIITPPKLPNIQIYKNTLIILIIYNPMH